MKCPICNFEIEEGAKFCTACGAQVGAVEPDFKSTTADKILSVLKDKLFLVICILFSVGTAASLISDSLPIINILITIFLWLTYSSSLKNIADDKNLRRISGCVYANYVVMNVASIIIIVCGVILTIVFSIFGNTPEFMSSFTSSFEGYAINLNALPQDLLSIFGWVIGAAFVLLGVGMLVFNILGTRKIHRFAKSFYMAISNPAVELENTKKVKNWLIFFGVCTGVSALSSLTTSLWATVSGGCIAAVIFLAVTLIDKYFIKID